MRNLAVSLFALTFGLSAFAGIPNLYECSGRNVKLNYTTSSLDGKPTLSVTRGNDTVSRRGNQIVPQKTLLGSLVSVTRRAIPDYATESVSVVIPYINLTDRAQEVEFETVVIETISRTSIGGPSLVQGLVTSSTYETVSCKAQHVLF